MRLFDPVADEFEAGRVWVRPVSPWVPPHPLTRVGAAPSSFPAGRGRMRVGVGPGLEDPRLPPTDSAFPPGRGSSDDPCSSSRGSSSPAGPRAAGVGRAVPARERPRATTPLPMAWSSRPGPGRRREQARRGLKPSRPRAASGGWRSLVRTVCFGRGGRPGEDPSAPPSDSPVCPWIPRRERGPLASPFSRSLFLSPSRAAGSVQRREMSGRAPPPSPPRRAEPAPSISFKAPRPALPR